MLVFLKSKEITIKLYWKIALRPNLTKLLRAIPSSKLHNFYNYHLHVSLTGDCQNAKILKTLRSKFSKTYYCRSMKLCMHVYHLKYVFNELYEGVLYLTLLLVF